MHSTRVLVTASTVGVILLAAYLATFPTSASAGVDFPILMPSADSIVNNTKAAQEQAANTTLQNALQNPPVSTESGQEAAAITCSTFGSLGISSCESGSGSGTGNGSGSSGGSEGSGGEGSGGSNSGGGTSGGGSGEESHGGSSGGTGGESGSGGENENPGDDTGTETGSGGSDGSTTSSGGSAASSGGSAGGGGGGGGIPGLIGLVNDGYGTMQSSSEQCSQFLTENIKRGVANDSDQVIRLQTFLRDSEHFTLTVNGVYDQASYEAVQEFQMRYAADILVPWGLTIPTGYVYHTTKKKINELHCKHQTAFPLTSEEEKEVSEHAFGTAIAEAATAEYVDVTEHASDQSEDHEATETASTTDDHREGVLERFRENVRSFFGKIRGIFSR